MEISRDVIIDLLPVYLSGDASPATRALVESFFQQDADFARRVRLQWSDNLDRAAPEVLPPDLELRSLKRTRGLLTAQKRLFGLALAFSAFGLSFELDISHGRLQHAQFLFLSHPGLFGVALAIGAALWVAYTALHRRVHRAGF
jgi:anti-sigma factor RsiW